MCPTPSMGHENDGGAEIKIALYKGPFGIETG